MRAVTLTDRDRAETLVERTGARVTRQRVEVLKILLAAPRALTHHEIEQRAHRGPRMDRVTIYRVLEWLTANGLAHKIAGDDRVWRFNAAEGHGRTHAHFHCSDCGEVICLDEVAAARNLRLPQGYRSQELELTVRGLCAACRPARRAPPAARHRH
ncbi:MAG: transcriptional repressor [Betaproteobacteria bacterium]|nr:transcriptional repressor [Betaproteobacteria bacterium]